MTAHVSTVRVRRRRAERGRRSMDLALRTFAAAAVLLAATLAVSAFPQRAHASEPLVIPERVGSFARAEGERWGYLYSNTRGVGAIIGRGTRSDTKKVVRTIEYGIAANEGGLKLNVVAEHTVRYEVYASGAKRGQIYRVYQPKVRVRTASGRLFYLWKLKVSLKSAVMSSNETDGGGEVYRVRHQLTLSLPRQPLLPRNRWIELARQLAEAKTGPYIRSVTIVPNGGWGRVVVGFE